MFFVMMQVDTSQPRQLRVSLSQPSNVPFITQHITATSVSVVDDAIILLMVVVRLMLHAVVCVCVCVAT